TLGMPCNETSPRAAGRQRAAGAARIGSVSYNVALTEKTTGEFGMPVDEIEFEAEELMETAVAHLRDELKGVRTGRATPGLVEHIRVNVESYGSTMELRELASISVPEANQLLLKPFD